jgi:hypothetical protein
MSTADNHGPPGPPERLALPLAGLAPGPGDAPGTAQRHLAKGDQRDAATIWRANPREQGLLGLTDAIHWFGANGYSISLPLIDAQPYDLIVDDGDRLQRVQVKTTTYRSPYGIYVVSLATRGGNQSFHTSKPFDPGAAELLYVLTDSDERYLIPTHRIRARGAVNLGKRMAPYRLTSALC